MYWIAIPGTLVAAYVVYVVWAPYNRGLSQNGLADILKNFAITFDNGGTVRITVHGTKAWLTVERACGDGEAATLSVRIPRLREIEGREDQLRERFQLAGFDWEETADNISILGKVGIKVYDIWNPSSYSRVAMAIREFWAYLNIGHEEKIKIIEFGKPRIWPRARRR